MRITVIFLLFCRSLNIVYPSDSLNIVYPSGSLKELQMRKMSKLQKVTQTCFIELKKIASSLKRIKINTVSYLWV